MRPLITLLLSVILIASLGSALITKEVSPTLTSITINERSWYDIFGWAESRVATVELKSPLHVKIDHPSQPVMEWSINTSRGLGNFLGQMEAFEDNLQGDPLNKTYRLEYFDENIGTHKVWEVGQNTDKNSTLVFYSEEKTYPGSWQPYTGQNLSGIVRIRVFDNNPKEGQLVELVPNLFGARLEEWATYFFSTGYDTGQDSWARIWGGTAGGDRATQIFTPATDITLGKIEVLMGQAGNEGTLYGVVLNTTNGSASGFPDYASQLTTIVNVSQGTITAAQSVGEWYNLTFNSDVNLAGGVSYALFLMGTGGMDNQEYSWQQDSSGSTYPNYRCTNGPTFSCFAATTNLFRVYGVIPDIAITLVHPNNGTAFDTQALSFAANVQDPDLLGIKNVSLVIDGVIVQTNTSTVTGLYNFSQTVIDGNHNWTIIAYDNSDDLYNAINGTLFFSVDTTHPLLNITIPTNNQTYIAANYTTTNAINIPLNWTVQDLNLNTCWYTNITSGLNQTITCGNNVTFTAVPFGTYSFYVWANDTVGNIGKNLSQAEYIYKVFENAAYYKTPTQEGLTQSYILDVNVSTFFPVTSATLTYGGSSIATSATATSGNLNLSASRQTPSVTVPTNYTFYWTLNLNDGTSYNSSQFIQTVNPIQFTNCTNSSALFLFRIVDEETQVDLSNTELEVAFNLYDFAGNAVTSYNRTSTSNPDGVCLTEQINSTGYYVDGTVRYSNPESAIEYYEIRNYTWTGNYTTQNITLYDLNLSDSTDFQLTFTGEDYLPSASTIVYLERQYISENTFKVVEAPITDANGQTILHMVRNDVYYNLRMVKDGELIGSFQNVRAFCQDASIGNCVLPLNALSNETNLFNYEEEVGLIVPSAPTYNESNGLMSFSFTSSDSSVKTVQLLVQSNSVFGNQSICSNSISSASGTLSCDVSAFTAEGSLQSIVLVDGEETLYSTVILEPTDYGSTGYLVWFIVTLAFILITGENKTLLMLGILVSTIGAFATGLAIGQLIGLGAGVGTAGIWIIILVVLAIWKLNKEKPS